MINYERLLNRVKYYNNYIKAKKIDNYMLIGGCVGVAIGLIFSVPIINEIFAWFILFGVCIKLYDSAEKAEREIVPYDFNSLLPPPSKKKDK